MANLLGVKIPDASVPLRVGQLTTVFHEFNPSDLGLSAGTISLGDTIELFTLPKGVRITWATARTVSIMTSSGTPALALTYTQSATGRDLIPAFTVSLTSSVALMTTAATVKDGTNSTVIRLSVSIGSMDRTLSAAKIYTMVQYEADDS